MKREHKKHATHHLGDMKMNFLAAVVAGVDKHLSTSRGSIMFSKLNDAKNNDRFRNHILDEFSKRSANSLNNIEEENVIGVAEAFQNKYFKAAQKNVDKVAKEGENFDHHELIANTFDAFEKVHGQLLKKL